MIAGGGEDAVSVILIWGAVCGVPCVLLLAWGIGLAIRDQWRRRG